MAVYSGSKRFNELFGSLAGWKLKDVDSLIVKPGYVSTELVEYRNDYLTQTVEETARCSVAQLGWSSKTYAGVNHSI